MYMYKRSVKIDPYTTRKSIIFIKKLFISFSTSLRVYFRDVRLHELLYHGEGRRFFWEAEFFEAKKGGW